MVLKYRSKNPSVVNEVNLSVDPGVCGFSCSIVGRQKEKRTAEFEVKDSQCEMVNKLSAGIDDITVKDLFLPLTRNPIFIAAERARCHTACPVPVAIVKTMEAVLGLAVTKNASFQFSTDTD